MYLRGNLSFFDQFTAGSWFHRKECVQIRVHYWGNPGVKRGTTLQAANRAKSQRRVIHSTVIRLQDKIRDAVIGYLHSMKTAKSDHECK